MSDTATTKLLRGGQVKLAVPALILSLAAVSIFTLTTGQVAFSIDRLVTALLAPGADPVGAQIIREIRLPRIATGMIAGAALGVSGVLMQALFRNPMADAWSLGLTAGGQMGVALIVTATAFTGPAAISFLTAFQGIGLTLGALLGVAAFAALMTALATRVGTITLLVIGLMLGFTVQGLVSVVIHFANRIGGRVYSGWNDGTFASTTSGDLIWLAVPVLAGSALAILAAKPLSSLLLGETYARSLGTDVSRLRWLTLSAVVILVAPVTAFCGPVTFIGLIVPHFARAIARTSRILPLLPLAALSGALLAISADAVVHLPWEQHFLHLNAILAIIGAPVVILLLLFSPAMRDKN
ncbi:iron ABC transporter permease [Hyphomonas sp. WL0036]|uniref:FecCD family ABC transporter permease n=1 Tax=Hyphomonas sediminis TaxID=2866160 RepID=UPI001C808AF0|nr:iron ABC transporter permease [Hyphomonas sediminis]MBY9067447.1 iron ABC transporter permease [Hyphomonas sediminis]